MQPPQEDPAGQPAFPGYGAPPNGPPSYPPYGGQAPPYAYYAPPYPQPTLVPQTSSFAIASLVCSLASWFVIPFVGGVIGVVLGHMARNEIRKSYGQKSGNGLAIAGLVIGYIHIGMVLLTAIIVIWFLIIFAQHPVV